MKKTENLCIFFKPKWKMFCPRIENKWEIQGD
jgi:hypothetical protein